MRFAQSVKMGAWFLICFNLLMAFGSIWIFFRMSPAIEIIIKQNEVSLSECENMLASLAMIKGKDSDMSSLKRSFEKALKNAKNNITEKKEPFAIESISENYPKAFEGDFAAKEQTVDSILLLSEINRSAMIVADKKAKQLGYTGAWGVVFMATVIFLIGVIFIRILKRYMINPLEEISSVLSAHKNGDRMRRCSGFGLPYEIKNLFNELNEFIDKGVAKSKKKRLR